MPEEETLKVETLETPLEPVIPAPEIALETPPKPVETPTAQTSGDEPLPEIPPTPNESAEAKTSAPEEQPRTPAREERQSPKQEPSLKEKMSLLQKIARATIGLRKEKKLAKILTLFAKQTEITNNQVEKLLHVSDATATRYLNELEKRGKLTQHGTTGRGVKYTKR